MTQVRPGQLDIKHVAAQQNRTLGHQEACTNGAYTKEDVHDEQGDAAANQPRHHQETDRVDTHGRQGVHLGIDDHATDVGRQRRPASASDQERREDRSQFADDDHHDQASHHVGKAHLSHHGNHFDNHNGTKQGRHDKKNRENFDPRKEGLHNNVSSVGLEITATREETCNRLEEKGTKLAHRTAQQEQAERVEHPRRQSQALPIPRSLLIHSLARSPLALPKYSATKHPDRTS